MTDTQETTLDVADAPSERIFQVPVVKGKSTVSIATSDIPDDVYAEALALGLKELVNRGMSKLTKASTKNEDELKSLAMAQAQKNVEAIKNSKIKFAGKKAKTGESAAVMTEARRLAKNLVKDGIKAAGMKISHVDPKEITAAAKELLEADPSLIEQAKKNLAEREKTPIKIDVTKLVHVSPKLVAKADAKKAASKKQLSATQAGKVAPRQKPSGATAH